MRMRPCSEQQAACRTTVQFCVLSDMCFVLQPCLTAAANPAPCVLARALHTYLGFCTTPQQQVRHCMGGYSMGCIALSHLLACLFRNLVLTDNVAINIHAAVLVHVLSSLAVCTALHISY
jgi:hypothetical protein